MRSDAMTAMVTIVMKVAATAITMVMLNGRCSGEIRVITLGRHCAIDKVKYATCTLHGMY